uniref:RNase H type-1 domain-containing protein n=1 Tax=Cannabis sativa TaxID=3483 RepID=A0A803QD34_CANSA
MGRWKLHVDGASNDGSASARVVMTAPRGKNMYCAVGFGFIASNNHAEYEGLLAGPCLAKELKITKLDIYSDSQLVVCKFEGEYQAKRNRMVAYLAKLASTRDIDTLESIPVEYLEKPAIEEEQAYVVTMWGIDLIEALPTGRTGAKYDIVAMDYYTKCVEAKPLVHIAAKQFVSFINRFIICRFGSPIRSSPIMGLNLVEATNKVIKKYLKTWLEKLKGAWVEELPNVLWAYRTTPCTTTGETPFALAYGCEAVLPIKMQVSSHRVKNFEEARNEEVMVGNLDLLEEKREEAQMRVVVYQ